jgi:hypothetical protein
MTAKAQIVRVLLALLMLQAWLIEPAMPLAMAAAMTHDDLIASAPICHTGVPAEPGPTKQVPRHSHDCTLCQICNAATATILPQFATAPIVPTITRLARIALPPPATGPPARDCYAASPRGPPASV